MKFKYFYVKEASLSKTELIKPVDGYSNRGELLLTKLMDGSPFELTGGLSSKLTVSDEELELIRDMVRTNDFTEIKNVKFKTDTGMLIPLGRIEKTLEFGSNKGSGGGSGQTKLVESVTAVVTAYYIKTGANEWGTYYNSTDNTGATLPIDIAGGTAGANGQLFHSLTFNTR